MPSPSLSCHPERSVYSRAAKDLWLRQRFIRSAVVVVTVICVCRAHANESARPAVGEELIYWLANMTRHDFTPAEMSAATGLGEAEIRETLRNNRLDDPKRRDALLNVR